MKQLYLLPSLVIFVLSCEKNLPSTTELIKESKIANWDEAVTETVTIEAPLEAVWTYVSDSNNARDWSVFFHHISPLPGVTDGQVGSLRRCHRMKDEDGPYWDEVVTEVFPLKRRQITTYNLNGFALNFLAKGQYAFVRQNFRAVTDAKTELSFQTTAGPSASIFGKIAFFLSKEETKKIFKQNLSNIKAIAEGKPRLHDWY